MMWTGIPFLDGGRDASGCDCWGLVRLYLLEEAHVEVPTYGETPVKDLIKAFRHIEQALGSGTWARVDRAQLRQFDVVLMWTYEKLSGEPYKSRHHMGIMTGEREMMLHTELGCNSVMVPLSHQMVRSRLDSFWRHAALA